MSTAFVRHGDLTVVAGYEDVVAGNGVDSLDALFDVSGAERLGKPGLGVWRERLRLTLSVGGQRRTFYLKRFRDPPRRVRREVLRSGTGASSVAGLEWMWMHRLTTDGIPCVQPVAFGEELCGAREVRSAILTAAAPGRSLEHWVGKWSDTERGTIRDLIPALAVLVARLHGRGYIHRDLYLSHVFHDPKSKPESSLCLIDLQRVFRPRSRFRRWIVKDLASLNFSAPPHLIHQTDRVRWLTHYLGASKLDGSARRLMYRVVGKTQSIARRDRRRAARRRRRGED